MATTSSPANTGDQSSPNQQGRTVKKKSFIRRFFSKNPVFVAILFGILAVAIVYFWKDYEAKQVEENVQQMATQQMIENNQTMLKLLCKPLVWSIRSELLRGNLEQVNIFSADLVKEKSFQFIHLIDPQRNVLLSTNKKLEGQPFETTLDQDILDSDSTVIVTSDNKIFNVITPVMGYDRKLAILIFDYMAPEFDPNKPIKK